MAGNACQGLAYWADKLQKEGFMIMTPDKKKSGSAQLQI
jgi:hypothetical protein